MIKKIKLKNVPKHLAIIMDGNGRWAKKKNLNRIHGHIKGIKSLRAIVAAAMEYNIKYLTVYSFSSENWQRPKLEVDSLMHLLYEYLNSELPYLIKNKIRLNFIGNIEKLPDNSKKTLLNVIDETKMFDNLHLTLALSYGSREEILRATVSIVRDIRDNKIDIEHIDEDKFSTYLYTRDMPDPDFLIRTSGEQRISNFMLYQNAYTEIYFTKTLWPDFGRKEFIRALQNYENRVRRFGKTEV